MFPNTYKKSDYNLIWVFSFHRHTYLYRESMGEMILLLPLPSCLMSPSELTPSGGSMSLERFRRLRGDEDEFSSLSSMDVDLEDLNAKLQSSDQFLRLNYQLNWRRDCDFNSVNYFLHTVPTYHPFTKDDN